MKKIATLTIACLFLSVYSDAQTFTDDFESYNTTTYLGIQSGPWRTWASTVGGGADDTYVITTDNHTTGGSKSIYFSSTSATGGPQDVVLPFNATPITSGQLAFSSWFKIPTGKTAYFNFQGNATMGNQYVFECFMRSGFLDIMDGGLAAVSGAYPNDTWFEVSINANVTTGTWELFINSTSQGTWVPTINSAFAIDYYPAEDTAAFWVDDVSFTYTPAVGILETVANAQNFNLQPNPAITNSNISVELKSESTVQVAVYGIDGALVSKKDYGKLSGTQLLPIETSEFSPGMYFVNLTVDGKTSVQKLIKK